MKRLVGPITVTVLGFGAGILLAHGAQAQQGERMFGVKTLRKVSICHGTASDKNPYVLINVDESALKGHFDGTAPGHGKNNHPDFLAGPNGCDTPPTDSEPPS